MNVLDCNVNALAFTESVSLGHKKKKKCCLWQYFFFTECLILIVFLSLLSDSNQRPRDYKSRALAN